MAYYAGSDAEGMLFEQHCMFSPEYYYQYPIGGSEHRARVAPQPQRRGQRRENTRKAAPRVAATPETEPVTLPPIEEILREVGMEGHAAALKSQGIASSLDIKKIDEDLLRKVGLKTVPRLKLLRHVAGYVSAAASASRGSSKTGADDSCCGSSVGPSEADSMATSGTKFSEGPATPRSSIGRESAEIQSWPMQCSEDWMYHQHHVQHHHHHYDTYQCQQQTQHPTTVETQHATTVEHYHHHFYHPHDHHQAVFGAGPVQPVQPVPDMPLSSETNSADDEDPILLGTGQEDLQSPSSRPVEAPTEYVTSIEEESVSNTPSNGSGGCGRSLRRRHSFDHIDALYIEEFPLSRALTS